jgi:hypothetical protein
LINGRPPSSELKTPLAAVTAARVLYRELESRMAADELDPKPGDWAVSVAYITADLSVLGFTLPYVPGEEAGLMGMLNGNIMLGLIFGMADPEAEDDKESIVMGARAFLPSKQTDGWLSELLMPVRRAMEDDLLDRNR